MTLTQCVARLLDDVCRRAPLLALVHTSSPTAATVPGEVHRRNPAWPWSSPDSAPAAPPSPSLLTDLDALVRREVNRDGAGTTRWDRDAERIAAEVATALARLRDDCVATPCPPGGEVRRLTGVREHFPPL